jgi:hypothetical protein
VNTARHHVGVSSARDVPEDEVRAFLAERHAEQAELALWLRDVIRNAEPDLTERVYRGWDGIGYRHPDAGYVCAIYPQADHVRLWLEYGAALPDPDTRLEGDGRGRYMAVADDRDDADALGRYVTAAVAQRLFRP